MSRVLKGPLFLCRLQVRLMLLLLIAVTPAIGLMIYSTVTQRSAAATRAKEDALLLARLATSNQQRMVEGASQFLAALSEVPEVKRIDAPAASALFRSLLASFPVYSNIGLMTPDGWIVASGLSMPRPVNSPDRLFFRRAVETKRFAVGEYQIGRITKKATVNFARPVLGPEGQVRGVVFVALGLEWLEQLAIQANLPVGATITAIDGSGTILARYPKTADWVGRRIPENALLESIRERPEGFADAIGVDGARRLYAYAPLDEAGGGRIYLAVGFSRETLFAGVNRSFAWALAGLALVTLLALLTAWFGGEALVLRQVRAIVGATDRLRGGDLDARTGLPRSQGELGRLAQAFDHLAESLQNRERERRLADERVLREQEFSARLVQGSMDGIVAFDRDSRITVWNSGMERISGYPSGKVLGRSSFDVFPFLGEIGEQAAFDQVLTGDAVVTKDRPFSIPETGRAGYFESHYSPLRDEAGAIVGGVAIVHDITERKKLADQFRQAQKMEAVGRLAGGIAHDFNNLLTAIVGYADLLRMRLPKDHPGVHDAEEIGRAGHRAEQLTRQLLAFSRQQVFDPKVVDLNEMIQESEGMLHRMVGEDIAFSALAGSRKATVLADAGQMHQVIMNLVVNARDAMPAGGSLTIETADAVFDEGYAKSKIDFAPGEYVVLAVTDTGLGMDAETRSQIFEPFFTTKEAGKGTGLGLSTVYGIVRQCGGHLDVYSEPGMGAAFKIYLPKVQESPEVERPRREGTAGAATGSETVLLVEDEEQVRAVVRETLCRAGYQVIEARDGPEALRLVETENPRFDLLLTDVVMPKMTGPDLAAKFTAHRPGLRVLFMSGYMEKTIVLHDILRSSASFISKPFTTNALLEKVRAVLDEREQATT